MWKPRCLTTLWSSKACYRDSFTFYHYSTVSINLNMNKSIKQTWVTSGIDTQISSFLVVPSVLIVNVSFHFVAINREEMKAVQCKAYILLLFAYLWFTDRYCRKRKLSNTERWIQYKPLHQAPPGPKRWGICSEETTRTLAREVNPSSWQRNPLQKWTTHLILLLLFNRSVRHYATNRKVVGSIPDEENL
jgi:hypothetical protein